MLTLLPTDARSLLAAATHLYDTSPALIARALPAWRGGFTSGASWMRHALEAIRGEALPAESRRFLRFGHAKYGLAKYGLASAASLVFAMVMVRTRWPIFALASVFVFYGVEAQFVFLFPLLLDNARQPVRDSLRWTRRAGGTFAVMGTVMQIAVTMLFGGLLGAGFIRSWAIGCLAVCIWYERLRAAPFHEPRSRLAVGARDELHVRTERIGGWQLARPLKVLYVSDLHLGRVWTRCIASQVVRAARTAPADLILLGGDLLDCVRGAPRLHNCVRLLRRLAPVYAIAGNHDYRAGLDAVRDAVTRAGGHWLTETTSIAGWDIRLCSGIDARSTARRTIVCAHDPSIYPRAMSAGIDLVFAGHLHGGQCVLFQRNATLYPGAWFARWTGLRFSGGRSTMLVSRGAGDTLPIRWNCPREVILCEIS